MSYPSDYSLQRSGASFLNTRISATNFALLYLLMKNNEARHYCVEGMKVVHDRFGNQGN